MLETMAFTILAPQDVETRLSIRRWHVEKCRKDAERLAERARAKGDDSVRGGDTALPEGSKH